ncbi:chorismate synthase [Nonlabens xiamenensis]|uniref:chorismate synthase n=1 Tax=Nonlabens xiamenensis TaxID=2341043 RepID=UPI000F60D66E|nr:chorismate synthase [Nonlabens xiamenensis]
MKLKNLIPFVLILSLSIGCESDDGNAPTTDFSYMPLQLQNNWRYDVTTGSNTENDDLEVTAQTGQSYELSSTPDPANTLMSTILTSGSLRETEGKLIGSGSVDFSIEGFEGLSFTIDNGVLFDQNARAGIELFSIAEMTTQTVQGYDLDINYTVRSVQQADVSMMTVNGVSYTDVIHSQVIINASISTEVSVGGFTTNVNLLNPQDIITIDNYWARDTGLIKSDNQLDYELEDFSAFGLALPVPQSGDVLTVQSLTAFMLQS